MDPTLEIIGYRIIRPLGAGGMGEVYLALQKSLQRYVAIKLIRGNLVDNEETVQRFLKEGEIVAKLTHPGIIKVFDTGRHGDRLYLAMEYLDGGTLKERITQGLPLPRKLEIFRVLLDALGYAHQQGIIHRDIKPQNILFYPQGIPVLSDFGIAKALTSDTTNLTATAMFVGSPRYMSPEQLRGLLLDQRVDIYAMGVLFYELLLEQTIYSSVTDPFALAFRHISDPVPQLPEQFAAFQPVLDGLMARDRNDRFFDTASALDALDQAIIAHGLSETTRTRIISSSGCKAPGSSDTSPRTTPRKLKSGAALGLAAMVSLIVAVGAGFLAWRPETPQAPVAESASAPAAKLEAQPQRPEDIDREQERKTLEQAAAGRQARERRQTIDDHQTQAMAELDAGNFADSLAMLEDGISDWPNTDELIALHEQLLQVQAEIARQMETAVRTNETETEQADDANVTPMENADAAELARLLSQAGQHLAANRLTVPVGNNAFEDYRTVLALAPDNRAARQGLEAIADRYVTLVRGALDRNRFQQARQFADRGLKVQPGHPTLSRLRQQIPTRRTRAERPSSRVDPCKINPSSRACWCVTFRLFCD